MKVKTSIILFGISFLLAILGEAYLLNVSHPHLFSIVGIGIVVILTGCLFFDSIWNHISNFNRKKEQLSEEEAKLVADKWDSRYTELLNIQKATYAALKKRDIKIQEDINIITDSLAQIIELQSKAMDGQKKALNISVNYSREHKKELIDAIKEECKDINYDEQLSSILTLLQNHHGSLEMGNTTGTYEEVENSESNAEEKKAESDVIHLYDDPNAALTADEIAKLFENFGK